MEMIAKVSKGSKMDQIYLPKNRLSLPVGSVVRIKPITSTMNKSHYVYYGVKELASGKKFIIDQVMAIVEPLGLDNVIITGSLLSPGFHFNDLDIILISAEKLPVAQFSKRIKQRTGIACQLITLSPRAFRRAVATDPTYTLMITRCVAKKRFLVRNKRIIIPQLLDLALLKSKTLIDNFDALDGEEKYYLTRNLLAIRLFIERKSLTHKLIDKQIEVFLHCKVEDIKRNLVQPQPFIRLFRKLYQSTTNIILAHVTK